MHNAILRKIMLMLPFGRLPVVKAYAAKGVFFFTNLKDVIIIGNVSD